jgi:hypothetical protein
MVARHSSPFRAEKALHFTSEFASARKEKVELDHATSRVIQLRLLNV